jgi:hypothetical protein
VCTHGSEHYAEVYFHSRPSATNTTRLQRVPHRLPQTSCSGAPMDDTRPVKRIRQACEPCRRKKSKCSGERPTCSTCWRLEQHCFYHGEPLQPARYSAEILQNAPIASYSLSPSQAPSDRPSLVVVPGLGSNRKRLIVIRIIAW